MAGTHEGSVKAAKTIEKQQPGFHKKIGEKGASVRHGVSPEEESRIAKKAVQTRKEHDPDAFRKMGAKGGKAKRSPSSEEEE